MKGAKDWWFGMVEPDELDAQIPSARVGALEIEKHDKIRYSFVQGYSFCTKSYSKVLNVKTVNGMGEGLAI